MIVPLLLSGMSVIGSAFAQTTAFGVDELLAHLQSLKRVDVAIRWRSFQQMPGTDAPARWEDAWHRVSDEVLVCSKGARSRTETATGESAMTLQSERRWIDGALQTITSDAAGKSIRIESTMFKWGEASNLSNLAMPGLLIDDPSQPNRLIAAVRRGQILSTKHAADTFECTLFVDDADFFRWTLTVQTTRVPKLLSIVCEQATWPADRPFDQRVLVRTTDRFTDWHTDDGRTWPTKAIRISELHHLSLPLDKRPATLPPDGIQRCVGGWELLDIAPLDKAAIESQLAFVEPAPGDLIDDGRLNLVYRLGGSTVSRGSEQFRLPDGETIDAGLGRDFLERLPSLQRIERPSAAVPPILSLTTSESSKRSWISYATGSAVAGAGIVVLLLLLLLLRRRT